MAQLPDEPLDADGCDEIDEDKLRGTLVAGAVMQAWAKRGGGSTNFMGLPMGYLVDLYFADGDQPEYTSNITRIVFRLDERRAGEAREILADLDASGGAAVMMDDVNGTVNARADLTRDELEAQSHTNPVAFTFELVSKVLDATSGHPARIGDDLRVVWRGWDYFEKNALRQVIQDAGWAAGSLLFVLVYLWAHTCSLVQAVGGVLGILAAFPLAVFLYRTLFGISWIGALHFVGIFVILGIGADDIFVICEHWRQSATAVPASSSRGDGVEDGGDQERLVVRMAWTLRHSVSAILATSCTTAVAFAANCISTIAPIRLFGLFMALLIAANLVLVVTLLPALIIINETSRGSRVCSWFASFGKTRAKRGNVDGVEMSTNALFDRRDEKNPFTRMKLGLGSMFASSSSLNDENIASGAPSRVVGDNVVETAAESDIDVLSSLTAMRYDAEADDMQAHCTAAEIRAESPRSEGGSGRLDDGLGARFAATIGRVFGGKFANFIIRFRRVFVLILIALVAMLPWLMTKIPGPSDRPSLFPPWHNQNIYFMKELEFASGASADSVSVTVVFGALPRDDGPISNPYDLGTLAPDPLYDASDPASQEWMLRMCDDLEGPGLRGHVRPGSLKCWPRRFDSWLRQSGYNGKPMSMPLNRTTFDDALYKWWLGGSQSGYEGGLFFGSTDGLEMHHSLKTLGCPGSDCGKRGRVPRAEDAAVLRGHYFRFTTRTPYQRELAREEEEWHFWESWTSGQLVAAPVGLQNGYQTSLAWVLMSTDNSMLKSAWQSLSLSMALAFVVLIVATRNLWLSVLSCLCMSGVASCFLAFMILAGWTLGPVESISMTVLVGLSVDYVVHIAIAYGGCTAWGRVARSRYALRSMGSAIVAGAATTIGAALFLFACVCIFFTKFGTFVVVTLCGALIHALVILPALLAQAGPQGVDGELEANANTRGRMWRILRRWLHLPASVEHGWQRVNDDIAVDLDEGGSVARSPLSDVDGDECLSDRGFDVRSESNIWSDPGPSASIVAAERMQKEKDAGPEMYSYGNGPFTGRRVAQEQHESTSNQTWFRLTKLGGFFAGGGDDEDTAGEGSPDVELVAMNGEGDERAPPTPPPAPPREGEFTFSK